METVKMTSPHINARREIAAGRFLNFAELEYTDAKGVIRRWEAVDRNGSASAVFIVARIVPDDEILLVRQFRPPAGRLMLEFPAGLIDPGETPDVTAHRELMEETGYEGKLLFVSAPGYSSPGLTGESIALAAMEIDGRCYPVPPQSHPEECESIEVFRVPVQKLADFIAEQEAQGIGVDSKLHTWMAVRKMGMR